MYRLAKLVLFTMVGIILTFSHSLHLPQVVASETHAPSTMKMGMEIELAGEQVLASVFRYMEFQNESDVQRRLNPLITNEILDLSMTPEIFLSLPADLQAMLSENTQQGGKLIGPKEHVNTISLSTGTTPHMSRILGGSTGILNSDGKPISASTQIIANSREGSSITSTSKFERTATGIFLPEGTQNLPPTVNSSFAAWQTIVDRWKKLPKDQKLSLISPNKLPKDVLAVLFKAGKLDPKDFRKRSDLTPQVSELLDRLEWERDDLAQFKDQSNPLKETLGPIEFRHKTPLTDPSLLKKDIETFSRMVGIHRFISDPTNIEPDVYGFSFQVHVSNPGTDAKMVGEYLNRLRLIELYRQNRHEAAFDSNLGMGYKLRVKEKGLLRVIGDDRIEGRIHTVGYAEEVDRLVDGLKRPSSEVLAELKEELRKQTSRIVEIAENSKPGSKQRLDAIRVLLAANPKHRFSEEMSEDVAAAIRGFPYHENLTDNLVDVIAKVRYDEKSKFIVWQKEVEALKAAKVHGGRGITTRFLASLADTLSRSASLLDDLPCSTAFELLEAARAR